MYRLICSLILFPITCAALAAPAPKDGWERPPDPDNDCKIAIKDDTATMELPGSYHDFYPKQKCFNAPRLLREVDGDFVMQVRVSASFRPSAKSAVDGQEPRVAAGLVLIPADMNCIRLEYGAYIRRGCTAQLPRLSDAGRSDLEHVRGGVEIALETTDWEGE